MILLSSEGKVKQGDFEDGISRFSEIIPDLVMDLPHLPDYTWKMVLNPLLEKEIIHLSKITWQVPKEAKPKDESDDDDYYSGTEPFFKLLALVLASVKEPDIAKYGK